MFRTPSRIAAGFGCAVFVAFAALQYNDPDPVQWMAMYGLAAVACGVAAVRARIDFRLPMFVAAAALIWVVVDLPDVIGQKSFIAGMRLGEGMMDPQTEVSREVGGLVIVALAMLPLSIASFRRRPVRNKV